MTLPSKVAFTPDRPPLPPRRRFSRRGFLGLLGLGGGVVGSGSWTTPVQAAAAPPEVIEQVPGLGSCGPCALANALRHGDPAARRAFENLPGTTPSQRLEALMARYGGRPSETYGPHRSRFLAGAGIATDDMPFLANDLLSAAGLPVVRGLFLDQLPSEHDNERAHLRRVHGLFQSALAHGLPPILEVRAFTTDHAAPRSPWTNFYAHWLTLLSVEPAELPGAASGFTCRFADSFTGRLVPGFAYAERFRPFRATRGFSLRADGAKDWHWLEGHPYVLLQLPDVPMNLESCPEQERAVVALTYLVSRAAA